MIFVDYIQKHPEVFAGLIALMLVVNVMTLYVGGRKVEQRFKNREAQQIRVRERGASGYSHKSVLAQLGGATGVLEVVVTDADVWIKGIWPPFSYIGAKFDLTHRIARSQIRAVGARDDAIELRFTNEAGTESVVVLRLKSPQTFLATLGA